MEASSILDSIHALYLRLQAEIDAALRSLGLTAAQWRVLDAALVEPGQSSAGLARITHITPQSMHALVASLEREGLLVRQPHREHGRVLQVYVSNAGEHRHAQGTGVIDSIVERCFATFDEDEREQFVHLLRRAIGAFSRR